MSLLTSSKNRPRRRRFLRRTLIVLAVLFVLYNIVSLLIVPPVARSIAEKKIAAALNRDVLIESVRFNPYVLSVRVRKLSIARKEGDGHFIAFDELYVNAQLFSSIFKLAPVLKEVTLVHPSVYAERNEDLTLSFSDLLVPKETPELPTDVQVEEEAPAKFRIDRIRVENGEVHLNDKPVGVIHSITEINLDVPVVSNMEEFIAKAISPAFSAVVNSTPLKVGADTTPFLDSMETGMRIDLEQLDLPFYFPYVPVKTNFKPVSGFLTVHLAANFKRAASGDDQLEASGNIALENLQIVETTEQPLLNIPKLYIELAPSPVLENQATVAKIDIESPEVYVRRDKDGVLNLQTLVASPPQAETPAVTKEETESDAAPWIVRLEGFNLSNGLVSIQDESGTMPVQITIDQFNILLKNLSTVEGEKGTVDLGFRLNETCTFKTSGNLAIAPPAIDMNLELKDLALTAFQGYVPPELNVLLSDGRLNVDGNVNVAIEDGKPPMVSYTGNVNLADLSVTDRAGNEKFLNLDALDLAGIHADVEPLSVVVDSIALKNVQSALHVDENGVLNLQQIMASSSDGTPAELEPVAAEESPVVADNPASAASSPNIRVKRFRIDGGEVTFADSSVSPEYKSSMSDFDVTIEGIALGSREPLSLAWRSMLDGYTTLTVNGKIALDPANLYVDIETQLKNLSTGRLTPYSKKFIGYDIDEGKLNLALSYLIDGADLTAENKVFLDQFDLGDKSDPSKLKGIPVGLAIAILKDRNGQIKLSVPVRGRLDDPEFRVGQVIARFFMGLLEKAATSPFALLGSVLPGGESLSYVEFAPASVAIGPEGEEKLNTLVEALYDRPGLKLAIVPYVDFAGDMDTMRRAALMEVFSQRKATELAAKDENIVTGAVEVLPDEYERLVRDVFYSGGFDRLAANVRSVADMELVLLAHYSPSETELRALATQRAEAIRTFIINSEKVEAERVSIAMPESLAPEKREGIIASRVEFRLE